MAKFILNDETVTNSYGFRIPTKGIDLKRFKANPVMLDSHYNSISSVLGRWKNIAKEENGQLTAEDEFDEADEKSATVKGKVDRGFIKGCSMGVTFNREHFKQQPDGTWVLEKCELFEASICAIPSNSASLRLYASETGELLTEDEVKMQLSALQTEPAKFQQNKMYKLSLSLAALTVLALQNTDDGAALSAAIEKLTADNTRLKADLAAETTARQALQTQIQAQAKARAAALINDAITAGKLTADVKDKFTEMAETNYELAATVLATMPAKTSLSGQLHNSGGNAGEMTEEKFQNLSLNEQLAWKAANPIAFQKLFA